VTSRKSCSDGISGAALQLLMVVVLSALALWAAARVRRL
jgi:hypothetical protein